jgi:hypothetical protein
LIALSFAEFGGVWFLIPIAAPGWELLSLGVLPRALRGGVGCGAAVAVRARFPLGSRAFFSFGDGTLGLHAFWAFGSRGLRLRR